jgi:hypothetical protein
MESIVSATFSARSLDPFREAGRLSSHLGGADQWHELLISQLVRERSVRVGLSGNLGRSLPARPAPPGTSRRSVEQAWRERNRELLAAYEGEWVALEGESIVAHGPRVDLVVEEARRRGIAVPYVFLVEPAEPGIVTIGL